MPLSKPDLIAHGTDLGRLKPVAVHLEELGGDVLVRRLTNGEADAYAKALRDAPDDKARAVVLAHAVCDETGKRLFNDADLGDLDRFSQATSDGIIAAFREANKASAPKA